MSDQHPIDALSTLSAALANDPTASLAIAPELMGVEGLPPDFHSRRDGEADSHQQHHQHQPNGAQGDGQEMHGAFGGYQNSSAREEGSRGWSGYITPTPTLTPTGARSHQNPWEEGYRDGPKHGSHSHSQPQTPNFNGQQGETREDGDRPLGAGAGTSVGVGEGAGTEAVDEPQSQQKPRKRPRTSKPRQSNSKSNGGGQHDDGVPEEGIFDYAHPSGDYKLGPIFTYPSASVAQACVRCHKIKRKCDNARPRCAGCNKADVACVFELSPATVSYVSGLKTDNLALTAQIASAAERIQHLESVVSNMERGIPPPPQHDPPFSTSDEFHPQRADYAGLAKSVLNHGNHFGNNLENGQSSVWPLPPFEVAVQAVESFFAITAVSYPLLDKSDTLRDLEDVYRRDSSEERWGAKLDDSETEALARTEFTVYIVLAIGTIYRERTGEVEKGSSRVFSRKAFGKLQAAMSKEDMLCVQSLILLGIYSILEPSQIPVGPVVAFAARVSTALRLHVWVTSPDASHKEDEHSKRVFYSLYNLDRAVATTLYKPVAISDNDTDDGLPFPMPTDPLIHGRSNNTYTLQMIKLRRLLGVIYTTVNSASDTLTASSEDEQQTIIADLHARLDSWLADCPAPSPPTEEQIGTGTTMEHSWFSLQYNQALSLLYRPSRLRSSMSIANLSTLHDASARSIAIYLRQQQEQKTVYTLTTISAQYLACISLLYCLCEYDVSNTTLRWSESWRKEVGEKMEQCQTVLEPISHIDGKGSWEGITKLKEVYGKLRALLVHYYLPLGNGRASQPRKDGTGQEALDIMKGLWSDTNTDSSVDEGGASLRAAIFAQAAGEHGKFESGVGVGAEIPLATGLKGEEGLWNQLA